MIRIILIMILAMVLCIGISAQADDDTLTIRDDELIAYIRIVDGQEEYVARYGDIEVVYPIPEDKCRKISSDGRYLGSFLQNDNTLQIFHIPSKTLIVEKTWSDKQFSFCNFGWSSDNKTISILKDIDTVTFYQFYFDGINLTDLPDITSNSTPDYPPLPNYFPESFERFIYRSPNPNIFLYAQCESGELIETEWENRYTCREETDIVVYDVAQQEMLEILPVSIAGVTGFRLDSANYRYGMESVSSGLAEWSPDGRYIAVGRCAGSLPDTECEVVIYDVETDSYLETDGRTYDQNASRVFQWSNNHILMLWIARPFGEGYAFYPNSGLNYFLFIHVDEGLFIDSQNIFDSPLQKVVFAPDNRAIAFFGKGRIELRQPYNFDASENSGDLILISTTTGEHTVIDENVTQIITWRYLCDNPAPQDADSCGDA
jgi:hypothetical protein